MKAESLTQERLKKALYYNPDTGIFTWNEGASLTEEDRLFNQEAGCLTSNGYIQIRLDNKSFGAHRLAWLYTYGYLPEKGISHINHIRNENWIKNLQEVSRKCNLRKQKISATSKSGIAGVYWSIRNKKWQVQIGVNNKQIYIGHYEILFDAAKARYAAEQKYFTCVTNSTAKVYIDDQTRQLSQL